MSAAAPHPLDPSGAVELAVVERDDLIESRHLGAAVVLAPDGETLAEHGDADALIFPRSSLKPMQAIAMLRAGVPLAGEELVLASASHAGTPAHLDMVLRMLTNAGLDEDALQTPQALPLDAVAARAAPGPSRVAHMCSGKHAAFLAAAVRGGSGVAGYLDPDHPVQRRVLATVEDLIDAPVPLSGVDGCGAPLHAMTLRQLARGTALALTQDADGRELAAAIRAHPWALDGDGRANTVAIRATSAVVKGGAEGVLVAVALNGTSVAVKMLDGSARATTLVGLGLLARAGAVDTAAAGAVVAEVTEPVLGGDRVVGAIRLAV